VAYEHARSRQRSYSLAVREHGDSSSGHSPPATGSPILVAIYRYKNADTLYTLIRQSGIAQLDIRLWALDQVHERLHAWTLGSGPGPKYELINQLLVKSPGDVFVIVADDDIVLARGSLQNLLTLGQRSGFGLFQAAHARNSLYTYPITRRHPLAHARETTFVEIGPLFVVAPVWRCRFLPFSADIGMGWGLEIDWYAIQQAGCRFGVVDDVRVVHLVAPGTAYVGTGEEKARLEHVMAKKRVSLEEIQQEVAVWWRWQGSPPWKVSKDGSWS